MNLEANVRAFIKSKGLPKGARPDLRYASFDYCFNYFQSFREAGRIPELASPEHLEQSCLHLGFYLASWGMYRGSADLLQRSARHLAAAVRAIAAMEAGVWAIDADCYTDANIGRLGEAQKFLARSLDQMSDTLFTKIMLGVFGNVPAFDQYFMRGLGVGKYGRSSLMRIAEVYAEHHEVIDQYRIPTLDFLTGEDTTRRYTRAKVIDMAFFIAGYRKRGK